MASFRCHSMLRIMSQTPNQGSQGGKDAINVHFEVSWLMFGILENGRKQCVAKSSPNVCQIKKKKKKCSWIRQAKNFQQMKKWVNRFKVESLESRQGRLKRPTYSEEHDCNYRNIKTEKACLKKKKNTNKKPHTQNSLILQNLRFSTQLYKKVLIGPQTCKNFN